MATTSAAASLDVRHRAELAKLEGEMKVLLVTESRSVWEVGKRLRRIVDARLYAAGGYATFNAYVEEALGLSPTRAHLLKSVSRFDRAHVERFGWTKLALVLRLWRLLPGKKDLARVDTALFKVMADGRLRELTLDAVSNRQLEEAIKRQNALRRGKGPLDPRLVRVVDGLEAGLKDVAAFDAKGDTRSGVPLLSAFRIPFDQLVRFWRLLGALLVSLRLLSPEELAASVPADVLTGASGKKSPSGAPARGDPRRAGAERAGPVRAGAAARRDRVASSWSPARRARSPRR